MSQARTRGFSAAAVVGSLCTALLLPLPAIAAVVSDNFDDGVIDPALWEYPAGSFIQERNRRLEVTMPSGQFTVTNFPIRCSLRGDFDVQVDFTLLSWPASGTRLHGFSTGGSVDRAQTAAGNLYRVRFSGGGSASVPTDDAAGTIRFARSGATETAYHLSGGSWVGIGTGPATTSDVVFRLYNFADTSGMTAAYDNFTVSSGELLCVPRPTTLVASAALAIVDPSAVSLLPGTVTAQLTDAGTGRPLGGRLVDFVTEDPVTGKSVILCTSPTAANGVASCVLDPAGRAAIVAARGYTASFGGNLLSLPSTDRGPLVSMLGTEVP